MAAAPLSVLMQPEHIQNFQERLNQWVANQGFWFQIRHSLFGGGFGGKFMYHALRMTLRVALFLLIAAIGSWVYLIKRTESQSFQKSLDQSLRESLSATDLAISLARTQNQLEITRLGAEGGAGTFFSSLEARNIRCRMRLIDGLFDTWDPGIISISRLDADLRAGADDAESASQMARIVFNRPTQALVNAIDKADSTDADKIMNVLRTEKVDTTVGSIKFDARGERGDRRERRHARGEAAFAAAAAEVHEAIDEPGAEPVPARIDGPDRHAAAPRIEARAHREHATVGDQRVATPGGRRRHQFRVADPQQFRHNRSRRQGPR